MKTELFSLLLFATPLACTPTSAPGGPASASSAPSAPASAAAPVSAPASSQPKASSAPAAAPSSSAPAAAAATTTPATAARPAHASIEEHVEALHRAGDERRCEGEVARVRRELSADRGHSDEALRRELRARDYRGKGSMPYPSPGTACAIFGIVQALEGALADRAR